MRHLNSYALFQCPIGYFVFFYLFLLSLVRIFIAGPWLIFFWLYNYPDACCITIAVGQDISETPLHCSLLELLIAEVIGKLIALTQTDRYDTHSEV